MTDHSAAVLIVDDTRSVAALLAERVRTETGLEPVLADSLASAEAQLAEDAGRFRVAVTDLKLPDAPDGEVVGRVMDRGVPCLVLTGGVDDDLRDRLIRLGVMDYVIKGEAGAVDHVIQAVSRLERNREVQVLIVDDSRSARDHLAALTQRWGYQTILAVDGHEALAYLDAEEAIRIVLVDQNMPGMDGVTLIREIRRKYGRNRLGIIGISSYGSGLLSARQLKAGANDFLTRPFLEEEFCVRLNQNVDLIELLRAAEANANTDHLTGLYNRRYLDEVGSHLHQTASRNDLALTALVCDIDHFKKFNDEHGHYAGDWVLRRVAAALRDVVRESDVLVRYGGEEFAILAPGISGEKAAELAERIRAAVEALHIEYRGVDFAVTISVGYTFQVRETLAAMIRDADQALYRAKEEGRNRVAGRSH